MELSAGEVHDFLEADKRVPADARPGRRARRWNASGVDALIFHAAVEVGAVARGSVLVVVNISLHRQWNFKLMLGGTEVLLWHFTDGPSAHRNTGCPANFPRKVTEREHEHRWIEGHDLRCAVPLEGLSAVTHEAAFEAFCKRARVVFEPPYGGPVPGEQLTI